MIRTHLSLSLGNVKKDFPLHSTLLKEFLQLIAPQKLPETIAALALFTLDIKNHQSQAKGRNAGFVLTKIVKWLFLSLKPSVVVTVFVVAAAVVLVGECDR